MGLGHWLANIGKAAGYIAAPFTGGLSLLAEPAIGAAEGAANGGGWKGALKGGAIGGLEAAVPFGVGKVAGPLLGQALGKTGGGLITSLLGQQANKGVNSLENRAGLTHGQAPNSMGGNSPISNMMATGSGLGEGDSGPQQGYDENGNVTGDPSQIYQDMNGNVVSSSPDTGYIGFDVNGNPTNDPKQAYQNMNGDITNPGLADGNGASSVTKGASSIIDKILGRGTNPSTSQKFGDAASVFGGMENAEALNRYKKADMTQAYDRLRLQAQTDRNQNENDALHKLAVTNYLSNGGSHFQMPSIQMNGQMRTPTDWGMSPNPASAAQKTAAGTLQGQLLQRLAPGGSYMPTSPDYLNRGKLENVGQYGGVGTGIIGALADLFGKPSPPPTIPGQQIPGATPPFVPSNGSTT